MISVMYSLYDIVRRRIMMTHLRTIALASLEVPKNELSSVRIFMILSSFV